MKVINGLVACSDLTGFARLAAKKTDAEVFQFLSDYYELIGDLVAPAAGVVIKFMGDAALILFPDSAVDDGVRALLDIQIEGDRFLSERGVSCRVHVRAHFGPVAFGSIGTRAEKRPDIVGSTVNTLFLLKAGSFALTADAFRQLKPETRKLFKKHTPAITYIPVTQSHRD